MKTCPICGVSVPDGVSLIAARGIREQHRCNEKTLRGIDATLSVEDRWPRTPTYGERLAAGFAMMSG